MPIFLQLTKGVAPTRTSTRVTSMKQLSTVSIKTMLFVLLLLASTLTNPATAVVAEQAVGYPHNPRVSSVTSAGITVEWQAPLRYAELVTGYVLEKSDDDGQTWLTVADLGASTFSTMLPLPPSGVSQRLRIWSRGPAAVSRKINVKTVESRAVSAGWAHACSLDSNGQVRCWGEPTLAPAIITQAPDSVQISSGGAHACALRNTGQVTCWGEVTGAKTDTSSVSSLILTHIDVGYHQACGSTHDGKVACWGNGQVAKRLEVTGEFLTAVSVGANHMCALSSAGEVWCSGSNVYGQLGRDTSNGSTQLVKVPGLSDTKQLSSGDNFSCALSASGKVFCWGDNAYGQLGLSGRSTSSTPTEVPNLGPLTEISSKYNQSCGYDSLNTVYCWGQGHANAYYDRYSYAITDIAVGKGFFCFTSSDAGVNCPGGTFGNSNQFGTGFGGWVSSFVGDLNPISIDVNGVDCFISSNGDGFCEGEDWSGMTRAGVRGRIVAPSRVIKGEAIEIAAGFEHVCWLVSGGRVSCWGDPTLGRLAGADLDADFYVPDLVNVRSISAGLRHTCVVTYQQTVKCWGYDGQVGTLGLGGVDRYVSTPTEIPDLTGVVKLSEGSCALLDTGRVMCWGENSSGQAGNGNRSPQKIPAEVAGINNAIDIEAGADSTCALIADGTVKCWGMITFPQFQLEPILIEGLTDVSSLTGYQNWCATLRSGIVKCWGADFTDVFSVNPIEISEFQDSIQVVAGYSATCALLQSSAVICKNTTLPRVGVGSGPVNQTLKVDVSGPSGVAVQQRTLASLVVGWTPLPFLMQEPTQGYEVQWSSDGVNWISKVVATNSVELQDLESKHSYSIRVRLVSAWGFSQFSSTITAWPKRAPDTPRGLAVQDVTPRTATALWETPAADGATVTRYRLELKALGGQWAVVTETEFINHDLVSLSPNTSYEVRVSAYSENGWGDPSAVTSFVTTGIAPTAPTRLVASSVKVRTNRLSWLGAQANGSPITVFEYRWKPVTSSRWSAWKNTGKTATATVLGWMKGKKYHVQIRTSNKFGISLSKVFLVTQIK